MKQISLLLLCLLGLCSYTSFDDEPVVQQVDISDIENARPVTTLTNGKLITWTKGIDGNGTGDGYLTQSATAFNGDKNAHALPDTPLIPGTASHPEILLHYANDDSVKSQALAITGAGQFMITVQQNYYSGMYLALTSSEGASPLKIEMNYTDGTDFKDFLVPDYYRDLPANDPNISYLLHDLAKWGPKNEMREKDHHNIDLLNLHPNPKRRLLSIKIKKAQAGYLVFWAATGVRQVNN